MSLAVVKVLRYSEVSGFPAKSVRSVVSLRVYSVEKLRFLVGEIVRFLLFVERVRSVMIHSLDPAEESWTEPRQLLFSEVITLVGDIASEKATTGLLVVSKVSEPFSGSTLITVGGCRSESELFGAQDHNQLTKRAMVNINVICLYISLRMEFFLIRTNKFL